jgi:Domain of Unknown Function (DUF928)
MRRIMFSLLASVLAICVLASNVYGADLVPLVPDHVGVTTQKSPSLCWIQRKPSTGAGIIFTLKDSRTMKPTLEIIIPSSIVAQKSDTCHCVHLKDYDIQLEPNVQYNWVISFTRDSESIVAGGAIERCDEECMFLDGPFRCDLDALLSFARAGFWYDSISCLCDLIEANPQDQKLRRLLSRLLIDAGLMLLES